MWRPFFNSLYRCSILHYSGERAIAALSTNSGAPPPPTANLTCISVSQWLFTPTNAKLSKCETFSSVSNPLSPSASLLSSNHLSPSASRPTCYHRIAIGERMGLRNHQCGSTRIRTRRLEGEQGVWGLDHRSSSGFWGIREDCGTTVRFGAAPHGGSGALANWEAHQFILHFDVCPFRKIYFPQQWYATFYISKIRFGRK